MEEETFWTDDQKNFQRWSWHGRGDHIIEPHVFIDDQKSFIPDDETFWSNDKNFKTVTCRFYQVWSNNLSFAGRQETGRRGYVPKDMFSIHQRTKIFQKSAGKFLHQKHISKIRLKLSKNINSKNFFRRFFIFSILKTALKLQKTHDRRKAILTSQYQAKKQVLQRCSKNHHKKTNIIR